MNSKQIGNITEMECMLAFIKLGYNVLTPYGDCERYDFVVDINGRFYKIQSKTARMSNNGDSFCFEGSSSHRRNGKIIHHTYNASEIDYFVTSFNNQCYLIPVEQCGNLKTLRLEPPKNKQIKKVSWANDYRLEKVIKNL